MFDDDDVKTIAFALYPGITALDLVGPLQVCSALADLVPGFRTVVLAQRIEPMATDTPLSLLPSHTFEEVPAPHALIVPGGLLPTLTAMADESLLAELRRTATRAQLVGSVCTGSLLLGAAGLLEGRRSTTHWMFRHLLPGFGATPVAERWVEDGPFLMAAGVSAGIDMALHLVARLAGEQTARTVQLLIEYDPQAPFGGIDWATADTGAYRQTAADLLAVALADHPELHARLSA
ncbi:transcriptional regulator GlxA family with amidase domain [Kitasatospora sp. MAP12-15]|uniref:DJ-1/PfpI family protein n=1 Tax=unclassified Kitasatospora TaxID=2633591 RepID=UPI002476B04B|nr:DJ-1/PfpI family protein [Kitasatospora sp. MAP12-44]MDH6113816.1 transcriptional regulator GlxA family with amidase domain [Kitasatospora sp. MAP12-44]